MNRSRSIRMMAAEPLGEQPAVVVERRYWRNPTSRHLHCAILESLTTPPPTPLSSARRRSSRSPLSTGSRSCARRWGSTLHGTGLPGHEDRDEMGVYLEHPSSVVGLVDRPHWTFRTAGGNNRSTAAD